MVGGRNLRRDAAAGRCPGCFSGCISGPFSAARPPAHDGDLPHHPHDPHHDHRRAHRGARRRVPDQLLATQAPDNRLELKSNEDERQHVEDEDHDFPDGIGGYAEPRGHAIGRGARHGDGVDDDGDDARQVKPLRDDPHGERGHELHDHRRGDVADPGHEEQRGVGAGHAQQHAAGRDDGEGREGAPAGEAAGEGSRDGETVDEERRRVVEEALPLQDHEHPVGRLELAEHRGRRGRIGWGNDRAEGDRGGPRDVGHDPAHDHGHRGDRESDRDERETGHDPPVLLQVAGRRVERGVEEDRGHEERQRQLGIEGDARRMRQEREPRAGQGEQRRIRDVDPPCERRQHGAAEQQGDDELENHHGTLWPLCAARNPIAPGAEATAASGETGRSGRSRAPAERAGGRCTPAHGNIAPRCIWTDDRWALRGTVPGARRLGPCISASRRGVAPRHRNARTEEAVADTDQGLIEQAQHWLGEFHKLWDLVGPARAVLIVLALIAGFALVAMGRDREAPGYRRGHRRGRNARRSGA